MPAAFGLVRLELSAKALLNGLLLMALVTPAVTLALGCAHTVSALPYLVIPSASLWP